MLLLPANSPQEFEFVGADITWSCSIYVVMKGKEMQRSLGKSGGKLAVYIPPITVPAPVAKPSKCGWLW